MCKSNKKNAFSQFPVTSFNASPSQLPTTSLSNTNTLFSFEKFKCTSIKNKNKSFNNCFDSMWEYAEWSLKFIDRLSNFSAMGALTLRASGKSGRCHPVKGGNLTKLKTILETIGLELNEQFEDDYYELSLGAGSGRVFGIFIGNIYYILLFDPHHLIYQQLQFGSQHDLLHKNYDPWKAIF